MDILLIGGSGFLSGTVACEAVAAGHRVWAVTRGQKPTPNGVIPIIADRKDTAAFAAAITDMKMTWDLAVDCIGYQSEDAEQDVAVLRSCAKHFVFVSTDFVFDPTQATLPRVEDMPYVQFDGYGKNKRACELIIRDSDTGDMKWTIVRPCHIYGPGSQLGCLPMHSRDAELISRMKAGETLKLVGGGHFLQQPIYAADLAQVILACPTTPNTHEQIYITYGPDMIESRKYYEIIADILGVPVSFEELPVEPYLKENPTQILFMCHRISSREKLAQSGLPLPSTSIEDGLKAHVESML